MQNKTKALLIVLCSLVAVCCVIIGISSTSDKEEVTTTFPISSSVNQGSIDEPQSTTVQSLSYEKLIIGKWRDSADMSGYEFFEDGTVEITYVNLTVPVINMPVNGTTKGTYTLEGDTLTTKFSIYSATIDNYFKIKVSEKELSMTNLEEFETATYMRVTGSSSAETTKEPVSATSPTQNIDSGNEALYDDELIGSWISSDSKEKYNFTIDGKVNVKPAGTSKTYNGIYLTDSGKLTVQYVMNSKKVTDKFSYTVSKNSLSLTDSKGSETLFVREGTGSVSVSEDELLGTWMDGANLSGYNFKPDGLVEVTYMNFTIPVLNMPINGTYTGAYSVDDGLLTITMSLRGTPITSTYNFEIKGSNLTLKDVESGDVLSYIKQ